MTTRDQRKVLRRAAQLDPEVRERYIAALTREIAQLQASATAPLPPTAGRRERRERLGLDQKIRARQAQLAELEALRVGPEGTET